MDLVNIYFYTIYFVSAFQKLCTLLNLKMKNQLFFLFYEEEINNDVYAKLIKTYVNRLIIDEDAENDVMSVHILRKYHKIDLSQCGLFKKMKLLYYIFLAETLRNNFYEVFDEVICSFKEIDDIRLIQPHFLIGTSIDEYDLFLITTYYGTQIDCTVLSGSQKIVKQPPKLDNSNITIGDDIDLLVNSSLNERTESRNTFWQTYFTKTMISYAILDRSDLYDLDLYKVFECKRNFFPRFPRCKTDSRNMIRLNLIIAYLKKAVLFLFVFSPWNVLWLIAPYLYHVISRFIVSYLVKSIDFDFLVIPLLIGSALVSFKSIHIIITHQIYSSSNVEKPFQLNSYGYALLRYLFYCTVFILLYLFLFLLSVPDLSDLI